MGLVGLRKVMLFFRFFGVGVVDIFFVFFLFCFVVLSGEIGLVLIGELLRGFMKKREECFVFELELVFDVVILSFCIFLIYLYDIWYLSDGGV